MTEAHSSAYPGRDKMTKTAQFIAIRISWSKKQLADSRTHVRNIIRFHGAPSTIVSHRDPQFMSHFWGRLQEAFGTTLKLSTAFHPATG